MEDSDNSPTMQITVLSIIVLFLVVVFVKFLHLCAKWFWRQTEEPTSSPPLVFSPSRDTPLDITVLRSLPVVMVQYNDSREGLERECAVCLCEIEEGEKARLLPQCNHSFHVDCIDMWFMSHCTCPLCRSKVGPLMLQPTNGEGSSSSVEGNGQSLEKVLASGYSMESASFPTNVLVPGDETQVRANGSGGGSGGEGTSGQLPCRSCSFRASSSISLEAISKDEILVSDVVVGEDSAEDGESDQCPEPRR